jgi:hypothetical protein
MFSITKDILDSKREAQQGGGHGVPPLQELPLMPLLICLEFLAPSVWRKKWTRELSRLSQRLPSQLKRHRLCSCDFGI